MHVLCIFFVFITANKCAMCQYITTVSLYKIYPATCFDSSVSLSVLHLCLAKLYKFIKLKLLKSQIRKITKIY